MSKSNAGNIIIKSDEPNKISTGSKASAELLVHECAHKLQQHYPHHYWHVHMSKDQSVVGVRCLNIEGNFGFMLHTTEVQSDPDLKCVIRAGGEILERANLSRGKANENDMYPTHLDITGAKFKKRSQADGIIRVNHDIR